MKATILLLLLDVINCQKAMDYYRCNSTDGCYSPTSSCCTYIKQGTEGTGANGLYCAPPGETTITINGSTMLRGYCHSTPELADRYGSGDATGA